MELDISDKVHLYTQKKKSLACTDTVFFFFQKSPTETAAQRTAADTETQVKSCFTAPTNKMSTSQYMVSHDLLAKYCPLLKRKLLTCRTKVVKDTWRSAAQTTAKVKYKLRSQKL